MQATVENRDQYVLFSFFVSVAQITTDNRYTHKGEAAFNDRYKTTYERFIVIYAMNCYKRNIKK